MGLRRANAETKPLDLGDGAFVEVVKSLNKRDFNNLISRMPADVDADKGLTIPQGIEFQIALFTTLVKGWSMDAPPSEEEYLALDSADAQALDAALIEHFSSLNPTPEESKEPETSRRK